MHSCYFLEVCRLPEVSNGSVPNTLKDLYKPQDALNVTCSAGYAPSSILTICQSDRTWTPEPICTYVSCAMPILQNGYYTIDGIQNETAQQYGSKINPTCSQSGYTPSPFIARTCQESGTWSGLNPKCIPKITCNSLPSVGNGSYHAGFIESTYRLNQTITLICDAG